jgi:hypothetical protein
MGMASFQGKHGTAGTRRGSPVCNQVFPRVHGRRAGNVVNELWSKQWEGVCASREFMKRIGSMLSAMTALSMLGLALLGSVAALAQPAGDPAADDPPARIGRLSVIAGDVALQDGSGADVPAVVNWPISSGQSLRTAADGRAEIRIGSVSVRLDGDTLVDFSRVDDQAIQLTIQWGGVALRIRNREVLPEVEVTTQRERIDFDDVGRYRFDVDRVEGTTAVTTFVGSARVTSSAVQFNVLTGQRTEITGGPLPRLQQVAAAPDRFDDWVAERDRHDDVARSGQYVPPEMTGIESLDDHGSWQTVDTYGTVWVPSAVPVGWVPYRNGRWAYVAPWGWTWIDEAPWGFAPFHYGRWISVGGTWCWSPGRRNVRPVYAPALVAWIGSPGGSVTVVGGAPVGWFPLGPGDVFVPGYRASHRHVDGVNHGFDRPRGDGRAPGYRYRDDPAAVTWVPASTLGSQAPVNRSIQAPPPRWGGAPVVARPPVGAPPAAAVGNPGFGAGRDRRPPGAVESAADRGTKRRPTNPYDDGAAGRMPASGTAGRGDRPANGSAAPAAPRTPTTPAPAGAPAGPAPPAAPGAPNAPLAPVPPVAPIAPVSPIIPAAPVPPGSQPRPQPMPPAPGQDPRPGRGQRPNPPMPPVMAPPPVNQPVQPGRTIGAPPAAPAPAAPPPPAATQPALPPRPVSAPITPPITPAAPPAAPPHVRRPPPQMTPPPVGSPPTPVPPNAPANHGSMQPAPVAPPTVTAPAAAPHPAPGTSDRGGTRPAPGGRDEPRGPGLPERNIGIPGSNR